MNKGDLMTSLNTIVDLSLDVKALSTSLLSYDLEIGFRQKKKRDDRHRGEPVSYSSDGRPLYREDLEEASRQREEYKLPEMEVYFFSDGVNAPPSEMTIRMEREGDSSNPSGNMNGKSISCICSNCKSTIKETVNFCPYCGHSLKANISKPNETQLNTKYNDTVPDQNKSIHNEQQVPFEVFLNSSSTERQRFTLKKKLETYRDKLLLLEQRNRSILLR